ncbi:Uncharacterised protein [Mycobacteroides abscessus subsp. abscessus]|nr:Uncharacterised protein [Mycobacteroides abscessus subsp. abscessus]
MPSSATHTTVSWADFTVADPKATTRPNESTAMTESSAGSKSSSSNSSSSSSSITRLVG